MLLPPLPPRIERVGLAAPAGGSGVRGRAVAAGVANAYGAWVFVGAAGFDWAAFMLDVQATSSRSHFIDLAVGRGDGTSAAASLDAAVIVSAFPFQSIGTTAANIRFPLAVPAGQGVYARTSCPAAAQTLYLSLRGRGHTPGYPVLGTRVEAIGVATSPAVFGAGPAVADGSWRAVGVAARDYVGLYPAVTFGSVSSGRATGLIVAMSFALGDAAGPLPAGNPAMIDASLLIGQTSSTLLAPAPDLVERHCRAGTTIWARGEYQLPSGTVLPSPDISTFCWQVSGLVP